VRSPGIGCYFDERFTNCWDWTATRLQDLDHFTVAGRRGPTLANPAAVCGEDAFASGAFRLSKDQAFIGQFS